MITNALASLDSDFLALALLALVVVTWVALGLWRRRARRPRRPASAPLRSARRVDGGRAATEGRAPDAVVPEPSAPEIAPTAPPQPAAAPEPDLPPAAAGLPVDEIAPTVAPPADDERTVVPPVAEMPPEADVAPAPVAVPERIPGVAFEAPQARPDATPPVDAPVDEAAPPARVPDRDVGPAGPPPPVAAIEPPVVEVAPSSAPAAPPFDAVPPVTAAAAPGAPPAPPRLLVVDDSAVVRAKLRKLLEVAGHTVDVARDGREALASLAAGRYALMVTDLEMPTMSGFELIAAVRASVGLASLPIVAITGHDDLEPYRQRLPGLAGLFRKPWPDAELVARVAAVLAQTPASPAAPALTAAQAAVVP